jgi:hypothetical protein
MKKREGSPPSAATARVAEALQSASTAASYSVGLQVAFRMATFLSNAVVLSYATKELLGVVNVRCAALPLSPSLSSLP